MHVHVTHVHSSDPNTHHARSQTTNKLDEEDVRIYVCLVTDLLMKDASASSFTESSSTANP